MKKSILTAVLIIIGVPVIVCFGMFMFRFANVAVRANPVPVPVDVQPPQVYAENPINQLGAELQVGEPYHYRNLSIFPVSNSSWTQSSRGFLTIDRAIQRGEVELKEKGYGEVNTVSVKNKGKSYVFGLAGDMIVGAKQDRMLQHDVLVPPHSGWLELEVYCTEHGRWHAQTDNFGSIQRAVPSQLRAKAAQTESQSEVWAGVAEAKEALGDRAGTSALQSIYSDKKIEEKSRAYLDELLPVPRRSDKTVGALIAIGNRLVCLDVFSDHQLFSDMWEKLLRSYVMDALSQPEQGSLSIADARGFIRSLGQADLDTRSTPGSGTLYRVRADEGSGSGLVFDDQVVHLDLFPDGAKIQPDRGPTPNLELRRGNR